MDIDTLLKNNARSVAARDAKESELVKLSKLDKGKQYPYFGYVELAFPFSAPILMFSNNDDAVAMGYFWEGTYEPASLRLWTKLCKNKSVILDIGSYSGVFSLLAAENNRKAKVIAFEPLSRNYQRILMNCRVNKIGNIKAENVAVSNKDGEVTLNTYTPDSFQTTGSSIASVTIKPPVSQSQVTMVSVDSYLKANGLHGADLVKIDVEHAEMLVLEGMVNTLTASKPEILIEILKNSEYEAINSFLTSYGYSAFKVLEETDSVMRMTDPSAFLTLKKEYPKSRNFIFSHHDLTSAESRSQDTRG